MINILLRARAPLVLKLCSPLAIEHATKVNTLLNLECKKTLVQNLRSSVLEWAERA